MLCSHTAVNVCAQWCMMNPCHALASTAVPRMTNGRATGDNCRGSPTNILSMGFVDQPVPECSSTMLRFTHSNLLGTIGQTGCCITHSGSLLPETTFGPQHRTSSNPSAIGGFELPPAQFALDRRGIDCAHEFMISQLLLRAERACRQRGGLSGWRTVRAI